MIDVSLLRDDPEGLAAALARRNLALDIPQLAALDRRRREARARAEELRAAQKRSGREIASMEGEEKAEAIAAAARLAEEYRGALAGAIYFGPARSEEIRHREMVEDIIDLLEMEPYRKKVVGLLPYGVRKRVELGRALALEPKLLLLDEPMAGMNLEEKEDMARFIIDIHELKNIPIVLVEHDMEVVMDIAERLVVLDFGKKIAEGEPGEIRQNPLVIRAYLGEEESENSN